MIATTLHPARTFLTALSIALAMLLAGSAENAGAESIVLGSPDIESPFSGWTQSGSFGGPLCTVANCAPGDSAGPRSGSGWAWFGGANSDVTQSMSQTLIIPDFTATSSLNFWIRRGTSVVSVDFDLKVYLGGLLLAELGNADVPKTDDYQQYSIQLPVLPAGPRLLEFAYSHPAGGASSTNVNIDDIELIGIATPSIGTVEAAAGTDSRTPLVRGSVDLGDFVDVFLGARCAGAVVGSGSASDFAGGGISVKLPYGESTLSVRSRIGGGTSSHCSSTATYTATVPPVISPDTVLSKKHPRTIKKATTSISFKSTVAGSTFTCKLDKGKWKSCRSPLKLKKLKKGKHTVQIRAKSPDGQVDPSPLIVRFKRTK